MSQHRSEPRAVSLRWHKIYRVVAAKHPPVNVFEDIVGARQLRFDSVERLDARVRGYGPTAVVTGQTRMRGRYGEQPFSAHSRYTHVYVRSEDGWRLASAQGTPIAAVADPG